MIAYNASRQSSSIGISSTIQTDMFVLRYDIQGEPEWAVKISGAATSDSGRSVITDTAGLYITGQFGVLSNPLLFYNADGALSGITLTPSGNIDIYIANYDRSGIAQWATKIVGTQAETVGNITTDGTGLYVTGSYLSNPLNIFSVGGISPAISLTYSGFQSAYLVKYTSSGIAQWATRLVATGGIVGGRAVVADSTDVYITGTYTGTLTNYNADGSLSGVTLPAADVGGNTFIVKYNSAGVAQWAARIASLGTDQGTYLALDSTGLYAIGVYGGSVSIYNQGGVSPVMTMPFSGGFDTYIVKYTTAGDVQWATRIAGGGIDNATAITVDATGIYVTGRYTSTTLTIFNAAIPGGGNPLASGYTLANPTSTAGFNFLIKYNKAGIAQWATRYTGTNTPSARGLTTDTTGVYVAAGAVASSLIAYNAPDSVNTIPNITTTNASFIVKYNAQTGAALWATYATNSSGLGIAATG
jgi:hypothetical protein